MKKANEIDRTEKGCRIENESDEKIETASELTGERAKFLTSSFKVAMSVPPRAGQADYIRRRSSELTFSKPGPNNVNNGEEDFYRDSITRELNHIASHSKALEHFPLIDPATGQPHPRAGEVVPGVYALYRQILDDARDGTRRDFSQLPGGDKDPNPIFKHTNPQGGLAFDLEGPDARGVDVNLRQGTAASIRPAPRISDAENSAEMAELYWMALLRDVPFSKYRAVETLVDPEKTLVGDAIKDLDSFGVAFKGPKAGGAVTAQTLFRGNEPGSADGPYLSQFLLRGNLIPSPVPDDPPFHLPKEGIISLGRQSICQRQLTVVEKEDYLFSVEEWFKVQEGIGTKQVDKTKKTPLFIRNLRDLGNWVHFDVLYQHFLNACLILSNENANARNTGGIAPFLPDKGNLYVAGNIFGNMNFKNQAAFVTFGDQFIFTLLAEAVTRALKASWFQKWYVHRRLRPEEFGGRLHFYFESRKPGYPHAPRYNHGEIDSGIIASLSDPERLGKYFGRPADDLGKHEFSSYLLPQAFPEGCPTHPAYTSGHATVAGACATILKAFFRENSPLTDPANLAEDPTRLPPVYVASDKGLLLEPATGAQQTQLKVGKELNKLAANIALGRNGAGVHWRTDYDQGLLLGQAVGAGILLDQALTYYEEDHQFTFSTFDGLSKVIVGATRGASGFNRFIDVQPLLPGDDL